MTEHPAELIVSLPLAALKYGGALPANVTCSALATRPEMLPWSKIEAPAAQVEVWPHAVLIRHPHIVGAEIQPVALTIPWHNVQAIIHGITDDTLDGAPRKV